LLSQGGEFGFVLFSQAQEAMLVAPEGASLMGAVVTLSMATTPFLMMIARRYYEPAAGPAREDLDGPDGSSATAIVVGYGRFGQTVAQMLMAAGFKVTTIDSDAEQIDVAAKFNLKVYYGDGTRLDLLKQAGAGDARAIVFAMDQDQLSREELQLALKTFRQAAIFVRAYDRRALIEYKGLDTADVIREVFESAVVMARRALKALGVDEQRVAEIEAAYRTKDKARLRIQLDQGLYAEEARAITFRADNPYQAPREP